MVTQQSKVIVKLIVSLGIAVGLLILASCQSLFGEDQAAPPVAATATAMVTPPNTAADTLTNLPEPQTITLTFWTVERFSPDVDLVAQQLTLFEQNNPGIQVETILHRPSGQASILNFLSLSQAVAPTKMPDVVVLSISELPDAWRNKLIQPLDGRLDRTIIEDMLPTALLLGTIDDNLAGIPFELDVEHAVYNTGKVLTTPLTWAEVLSYVHSYQFPMNAQNGVLNDSLLAQYLSTGANLQDDQGNPTIDEAALYDLLTYYHNLQERGIIGADELEASRAIELWDSYLAGLTGMTHINAQRYLADRRLLNNAQALPIPSRDGRPVTIGRGWAFALVTEDPTRQTEALKLIETFMQSEANLGWAQRTPAIPTRFSAFEQIADDDPYWDFLRGYLQVAQPAPSFTGYDRLSRILLTAIQQVVQAEASPEEALDQAISDLNQTP